MNACITRSLLLGILALTLSAGAFSAQPDELFRTHVYSDTVLVEPGADESFDFDVDLIVSGPEGFYHRQSFPAGAVVEFDPSTIGQGQLPDGTYKYELRIMGTGQQLVRGLDQPETAGSIPSSPHSGAFTIKEGSIVSPDAIEPPAQTQSTQKDAGHSSLHTDDADGDGARDVVINDDQIITGSLCVGFDCVNGESFGFDTIRLKENNTRIKFEDTSSSSSFPSNDWELTANDSANGGLNRFSILDVNGARNIFTVEAGARANSLYVESDGDVGFGTSNPVLQLHVVDGNTPSLRLEQDGSSGFTAQTWDIAGNEANFFVRDVTGGSRLPLRIRPGAPTSSIDIAASGNVGIGTTSPSQPLHIERADNTAQLLIKDTGSLDGQTLLSLVNNGHPKFRLQDTAQADVRWEFRTAGTQASDERFTISKIGSGATEFSVYAGGDAEFAGDVTANGVLLTSTREAKTGFLPVDEKQILDRLASLDITQWRYLTEPEGTLHIGPVAEEFQATFGLSDGKTLNMIDTTGISFAAIKALKQQLDDKETEVEALNAKVERLERAVESLISQAEVN